MSKEIESYCKATKEQEVQPEREVKTSQSNFVLNQVVDQKIMQTGNIGS